MTTDVSLDFTPVPSLASVFQATPDKKLIFILGPVGSTKTTTVAYWLLMRAATQEPSPDGIRRTRFGIIRNTFAALKATILKDLQSLFGEIARWNGTDHTFKFLFADIDSEWYLLPLETPDDQRRLLSLQLTGVWINEGREMLFEHLFAAFSRTGRFPSNKHGKVPCTYRFLIVDSNMGVDGSQLHKFLEEEDHEEVLYLHQPGAYDERADWLQYLPDGYYSDLCIGATQDWIDQHINAEWGRSLDGEPIFASIFDYNYHVAPDTLNIIPSMPLLVAIDPGFNPGCIIAQTSEQGQLRVLREAYASNMLFGTFIDTIVVPLLQLPGFAFKRTEWIMDPAAVIRNAVTGVSPKGVLEAKGVSVTVASTNDVAARLLAIETLLLETRGPSGHMHYNTSAQNERSGPIPALLIDPYCEILIEGFRGKYRYKKNKMGVLDVSKPDKVNPWADVMDALEYIALGLSGGVYKKRASSIFANRTVSLPTVPASAWT